MRGAVAIAALVTGALAQPPSVRLSESGPLSVSLEVSSSEISTVDSIDVELVASLEPGLPAWAVTLPERVVFEDAGWTVVSFEAGPSIPLAGGRRGRRLEARLEPFLPGEVVVPALSVTAGDPAGGDAVLVETKPVAVTVSSVLPAVAEDGTGDGGLGELRAPPPRGASGLVWVIAGSAAAALVLLITGVVVAIGRRPKNTRARAIAACRDAVNSGAPVDEVARLARAVMVEVDPRLVAADAVQIRLITGRGDLASAAAELDRVRFGGGGDESEAARAFARAAVELGEGASGEEASR